MYKITFQEWLNSRKELFIHCRTHEEAIFLCEQLDKAGKTWLSGRPYTDNDFWDEYNTSTCYGNYRTFTSVNNPSLLNKDKCLFEFDEIEFSSKPIICDWFD